MGHWLVATWGYVKISGMIDESMDTEQMQQPPQPWEFRSKPHGTPHYHVGGIIVNLILGFAIYSMVLLVWGETVLPAERIPYGLEVDERLKPLGFEDGDKSSASTAKPRLRLPRSGGPCFSTP